MSGLLTEAIVIPAWVLGAAAALVVVLAVIAVRRSGRPALLIRLGAIAVLGLLGWGVLARLSTQDRLAERHALDERIAEFAGRSLAPGSPLTCLDATAGETVAAACEKVLFSTPETVASAVSYIAAGLELLAEGVEFANHNGENYGSKLSGLRRTLETDRYGFVAHVLATKDKCTAEQCDPLGLLQDPSHVKANLLAETYDSYVARHAEAWSNSAQPETPVAHAPEAPASGTQSVASAGARGVPVPSRYTFPSADSIPAVSIMNPEPSGPPRDDPPATASTPPAASASPAISHPPMPPRRPSPRTAQRQSAPVPLTPPAPPAAATNEAPPPNSSARAQ